MGRQHDAHVEDYLADANVEDNIQDDESYWDNDAYDWEREAHLDLCAQVTAGEVEVTTEMLEAIEDPDWLQELVEAICLRRVNAKKLDQ